MRHFVLGGRRVGGAGEQSNDRSEHEHLRGHIFSFVLILWILFVDLFFLECSIERI